MQKNRIDAGIIAFYFCRSRRTNIFSRTPLVVCVLLLRAQRSVQYRSVQFASACYCSENNEDYIKIIVNSKSSTVLLCSLQECTFSVTVQRTKTLFKSTVLYAQSDCTVANMCGHMCIVFGCQTCRVLELQCAQVRVLMLG